MALREVSVYPFGMSDNLPKIICLDDEDSIVQSLARLLKSKFEVFTALSTDQAFDTLAKHPDTAVVLCDYRMPEMNGVEFLRRVKHMYPNISRAILSGQIDLASVADALNAHDIHKFFLKPWENDYLLLQILEAVQMHRTLTEKAHFERLSNTDPITQLNNHRFFQDELRRQIEFAKRDAKPMALVMLDVDHFKSFNDRFGHPEGDRLLYGLATVLKALTAGVGTAARYGGEEFALILPGFDAKKAFALTDKIRLHLEKHAFAGLTSSQAYMTMSGGVASFPADGAEASLLIESADRALYQAKRQGRNQIVVFGFNHSA